MVVFSEKERQFLSDNNMISPELCSNLVIVTYGDCTECYRVSYSLMWDEGM